MIKIFITFLLFTSAVHSASIVVKKNILTFKNDPALCEKNDSCSLEEFTLVDEKKKLTLTGSKFASYSTDVRFVVKASTVDALKNYGIVQFIRGCQYHSDASGNKFLDISRHHFDQIIKFQHKDWSVDSDNADPVYTAWSGKRFSLYRWNKNPASLDPDTATYLAQKNPPHPVVFATDLPGSFTSDGKSASNSSLEFEVCIFRIDDLPLTSTPDGSGIRKEDAIKCHKWESKFTFDFKQRQFIIGGKLEHACLTDRS